MNIAIRIDYIASGNKMYQTEYFPLRGRKYEVIAFKWWKQIKKEMSYRAELEKVTANGEEITVLVQGLEDKALNNNLDLPF
jgi:hypothetical protein